MNEFILHLIFLISKTNLLALLKGTICVRSLFFNTILYHNCRTLSNGQRGEVYEINGDQAAVIFDPSEDKLSDDKKDEASKEHLAKPAVCWVDSMLLFPVIHSFVTDLKILQF